MLLIFVFLVVSKKAVEESAVHVTDDEPEVR